ncbi:TMhelix containing protein [Vibrio phage 1.231.O._10N.261.49.F8]|nr:TMhelix containing protein [Vibrio phage 1.119.O._10N.261.51.A9]AUR89638.1 TMhelix containing protein [Vibrio phage 1.127.O._10N.286.52.E12]AUR90416.1 TMhelix containing protein [Vibrio phage 1.143.O._10N.261.55.C8]AUR96702.1 TMhelix containing protein [Vibrio phage 1.231.O._10N.261.49.F8]
MIEILGGIVLTLIAALYFVYNSWQSERSKRSEAEEKVLAHEALQRVNEDIANGGDEYISSILRESTRTVRSDSTGNDISK